MDFGNNLRKYNCFACDKVFDTYADQQKHLIELHEEGREFIICPLQHCKCAVRCLRTHFDAKHCGIPVPKNCQLRATIWFDQKTGKRKPKFMEGNFISVKNSGRSLHYRSSWELKVYKILESMADVQNYFVEPFKIEYFFNGKQRNYVPDLLINFVNGHQELWEIKPEKQKRIPQILAKKAAAENYCLLRGITYEMITENEIEKLFKKAKDQLNG